MPEEIKQEVVLKTQKYLGKYVKKPPLNEKLLKKPPFRFLHDVINTVIRETGFLKGLFSEEELNSENVKEKEAKVAFLSKLIDAVKAITSTDLAVRPSKIVAGLEPTETNLLLQTIGKAIEKKVDSSQYVNKLHSGENINNDKNKKSKKLSEKNEKLKKPSKIAVSSTPKGGNKIVTTNDPPKSTDREKTKSKRTSKESKSKTGSDNGKPKSKEKSIRKASIEDLKPHFDPPPLEPTETTIPTDQPPETSITDQEDPSIKTLIEPSTATILDTPATPPTEPRKRTASASRPKSARPKSGDLKEPETLQIQSRPKTSLRPPSVRPSSARPGAPRLRPDSALPIQEVVPMGKINVIIENFDKDDEEETVVIQSQPEAAEEQVEAVAEVAGENKGQLVEEILQQMNESEGNKGESDWQKEVFYGKESTAKEANNLKSLIQSLTKTANPLGKLLNYLHEDIDAMHAELESWTHTKRQLLDEISKQKKISAEMNKPLVAQLEHLTQEIKRMEDELVSTRSNILRNDAKIKELLSK